MLVDKAIFVYHNISSGGTAAETCTLSGAYVGTTLHFKCIVGAESSSAFPFRITHARLTFSSFEPTGTVYNSGVVVGSDQLLIPLFGSQYMRSSGSDEGGMLLVGESTIVNAGIIGSGVTVSVEFMRVAAVGNKLITWTGGVTYDADVTLELSVYHPRVKIGL